MRTDHERWTRGTGARRAWMASTALAVMLAGCAAPVVYRDPATGRTVDCTAVATGRVPGDPDAARAVAFPLPSTTTGTDVPRPPGLSPDAVIFDVERQCAQQLSRAGWICTSGC